MRVKDTTHMQQDVPEGACRLTHKALSHTYTVDPWIHWHIEADYVACPAALPTNITGSCVVLKATSSYIKLLTYQQTNILNTLTRMKHFLLYKHHQLLVMYLHSNMYLFVIEAILTAPKIEYCVDIQQLWSLLTWLLAYLIKMPVGANCQQIAVFFEERLTCLYTSIVLHIHKT